MSILVDVSRGSVRGCGCRVPAVATLYQAPCPGPRLAVPSWPVVHPAPRLRAQPGIALAPAAHSRARAADGIGRVPSIWPPRRDGHLAPVALRTGPRSSTAVVP